MIPSDKQDLPDVFESTEVERLIGISSIHLNKFLERRLFGLRPSIRSGRGRGRRRLFSREDVFGVALVWWLYEFGLRSSVIQAVLDGLTEHKHGVANAAAEKLATKDALLIEKKARAYNATPVPLTHFNVYPTPITRTSLLVPTGQMFAALRQSIEKIGG